MGFSFTGKGSWFGGPRDGMDSGKMAGGNTTALPAVAVRLPGRSWRDSRKYLNHYVRVTAPNGKTAVYRIGDLGPNESTGRNVDITYSGLKRLGYTEGNFPTDAQFKVEYVGKSPGARTQTRSGPVKQTGAVTGGSDLQAQARRQAAAQWLLSSSKSVADLQNRVAQAEATVPASQPTTVTPKGRPTVRPKGGGTAKEQGLSPLLEMFYDPQGGFDNPSRQWDGVKRIGAIGGHDDHVHVAAGPKTLARLDKRAAKFGLRVSSATRPGDNDSFHGSGKARDYAGSPAEMAAWTRYLRRIYRTG